MCIFGKRDALAECLLLERVKQHDESVCLDIFQAPSGNAPPHRLPRHRFLALSVSLTLGTPVAAMAL